MTGRVPLAIESEGREPARHVPGASMHRDGDRRIDARLPFCLGFGFAGLILATRLAMQWRLPFPQCWLRKLTGLPCPTCGCTRSLLAWSQFDLADAFLFNPLFFIFCVVLLGWCAVAAFEKVAGRSWLSRWRWPIGNRVAWPLAALLLALNWLYLCLTLPK